MQPGLPHRSAQHASADASQPSYDDTYDTRRGNLRGYQGGDGPAFRLAHNRRCRVVVLLLSDTLRRAIVPAGGDIVYSEYE